MNRIIIAALIFITSSIGVAGKIIVDSPNKKINIELYNRENSDLGNWYLKISCKENGNNRELIPQINLGLSRSDQDFSKELKFIKVSEPLLVNEKYYALHGKRAQRSNSANEIVVSFENPGKAKLNLIIRAYNDGIAFRYEFPEKSGAFIIKDEMTSYTVPEDTKRWMEKWDLANEGLYTFIKDKNVQQTWSYPALFNSPDSAFWYLIHEGDVNRGYCGSKLSNIEGKSSYKIAFPDTGDGDGKSQPNIVLPWKSPWRLIIIGSLADIVESTLVEDVSPPSVVTKTDWIKPGIASWNYWSHNHGTKDYKVVCEFADLAAAMNWPYTLLDWEWDTMGNGGNLEDAVKYILSKGVKPLVWYNSGVFKWVQATPRDRLLDILDDAAQNEMMIYFHGCIVPRGWSRTYPHLMTLEGIRGAEWYNNGPEFTTTAPEHNTIIPFTRNVVGPMDYTPVTFTNSQFPHITSYGHELALSVVYESGIQHMADRPSGFYELPDPARTFLKEIPNTWDNTKLIDGYPGREIIIARQKQDAWYIGALNSENIEKKKTLTFGFLEEGVKYKLTLIADGKHDKDFTTSYLVVDSSDSVEINLLRRGGFAACLKPIE